MSGDVPIDKVLTMLSAAPARLEAVAADADPSQLHTAPAPGEWSAVEVLAHLRACSDVWGGCIVDIAVHRTPTLKAVNPRTWMTSTDYPTLEFGDSLAAFTTQRTELLALLESLSAEDWERTATVTGAGKPLQRTPLSYASWLANHERPHLKQIERTVAALPSS